MTETSATPAPTASPIHINFDNMVDIKATKFAFRPVKDEVSGVTTKRETIELKIPVPSMEGIAAIFNAGGPMMELITDSMYQVIIDHARDLVNGDEKLTSENFPYAELDWNHLANLPKDERRQAFPPELLKEFKEDWCKIMPAVANINAEQAANSAHILATRFNQVKTRKDIVSKLLERLNLFTEHTTKGETFAELIEKLQKKGKELVEAKEEKLEDNLGL